MERRYSLQKSNKYSKSRIKKIVLRGMVKTMVYGSYISLAIAAVDGVITNLKYTPDAVVSYAYAAESDVDVLKENEDFQKYLEASENGTLDIYFDDLVDKLVEEYTVIDNVEYLSNYEEDTTIVNVSEEELLIREYCDLYQVDYDIVYNKLSELTNNFTSEEYKQGTIPGIKFKKRDVSFDDKRALLLASVRCIKQTPGTVGLNNVSVNKNFETDMDYLEAIDYYCEIFNVDSKLVRAIIQSETSVGLNEVSNTNNLGNVKDSNGKFMKLGNNYQSIIEVIATLLDYHYKYGYNVSDISLEYKDIIKLIGSHYAPVEDNNQNWVPNVTSTYRSL